MGNLLADRYEAIKVLGMGGMGEVWLAHDSLLGRRVAIKRILTAAGSVPDPHARERIHREAKLAATLQHPNVVAIHDLVHDHAGVPHVIMEYVDGESLSDRLRRSGSIAPEEAARLLVGVCDALAHAHAVGILHRDIKPANILVDQHARAKVADFGIARTTHADTQLTAVGQFVGSVAYLAPEIAVGHSASTASDVYSLGATLFHLIEGHPPFDRGVGSAGTPAESTAAQLLRLVQTSAPLARRGGPLTPVIAAMLDPDPARRPSAAQAAGWLTDPAAAARDLGTPATSSDFRTHPLDLTATVVSQPAVTTVRPRPSWVGVMPMATSESPTVAPGHRWSGRRAGLVVALVLALGATGLFMLIGREPAPVVTQPSAPPATVVASGTASATVPAPVPTPSPTPTPPPSAAPTSASASMPPTASITSAPNSVVAGSIVSDAPGKACPQTGAPAGWGPYPAARCTMWQRASGLLTGATVSKGERLTVCQRDLSVPNPVYTANQANTWWIWMATDNGTWDWFPETAVSQGATRSPINGIALCTS